MTTNSTPGQNPDCYARALDRCSDEMSREHYMSEGALKYLRAPTKGNPSVYARNHGRRERGVQKLLDIGRLTAQILCTTHNSALSPFDDESIAMLEASESIYDADNSGDQGVKVFTIDGDRLERWMLKSLIGGLYSGRLWADLAAMQGEPPPIEWLEVLYERRNLPDRHGLYWQPTEMTGLGVDNRDEFEVMPWMSADDKTVLGLHAWFFSFHFALLMANVAPGSVAWQYRPAGLKVAGCKKLIEFNWKGGPGYPRLTLGR